MIHLDPSFNVKSEKKNCTKHNEFDLKNHLYNCWVFPHVEDLYIKGLEKESFYFFFFQFFCSHRGRRKERERGEPPFLKLKRKI